MQTTHIYQIGGTDRHPVSFEQISKYGEPTRLHIIWGEEELDFLGKAIWDACAEARLYFEEKGYLIGWNICALNAVQSPMLYESGMSVYLVELGHAISSNESEYGTFDLKKDVTLATVEEQKAFKENWFESLGN